MVRASHLWCTAQISLLPGAVWANFLTIQNVRHWHFAGNPARPVSPQHPHHMGSGRHTMSIHTKIRRLTVRHIAERKGGEPLVCLTAYTAPMARLLDPYVDLMLVGDSVAQAIHGMDSTIPVPLDLMIYHAQAVMRGAQRACVVVDLPFGTYEESPEAAFRTAAEVLKKTGAAAVKIEGGQKMARTIAFLTQRGVPVMAHIGLLPQEVNVKGGYRVAGRSREEWPSLMADARAVAEAGAFCVVLEGTAEPLAREITAAVPIPTIGIGASALCDGQILVTEDMLGLLGKTPSFVRRYGQLDGAIGEAVAAFAADVKARRFPGPEHTYSLRQD